MSPFMKKLFGILFVVSSLGAAVHSYVSVDESLNVSVLPPSDVIESNLHKLSKWKESYSHVKRTKPEIKRSINESRSIIKRFMTAKSIPGLTVAVSHRGNLLWTKGFGLANVEQGSKCRDDTVMRIASISKPMTMLLVAKLVEDGKLDLDESIYTYLKDKFPKKYWDGEEVKITLRELASMTGGIRDYKIVKPSHPKGIPFEDTPELFIRVHYDSVYESLNIFKDDDLISRPGTNFTYTTLGWTLVSAVVQSVLDGKAFETYWIHLLRQQLGLHDTYLDVNDNLIFNRVNYYYLFNGTGPLMNAPSVDNSYKWAGGGLLSTAADVNRFGNIMLASFLGGKTHSSYGHVKGYLKESTVKELWTPVPITCDKNCQCYGLGWFLVPPEIVKQQCPDDAEPPFDDIVHHTGRAIGASSILLILPKEEIVVAMICNLQATSLYDLAIDVSKVFLKHLSAPSSWS